MRVLALFLLLTPLAAQAEESTGLCEDLAAFSCAQGQFPDGTGEVRRPSDVRKAVSTFVQKSEAGLRQKFSGLLNDTSDPKKALFRKYAIAAFGFKNAPDCEGPDMEGLKRCRENLLDNLVRLAHKQSLGRHIQDPLDRVGDTESLAFVLESDEFGEILSELNSQISAELVSKEVTAEIEREFENIKKVAADMIRSLPIKGSDKEEMAAKVQGIKYGGTDCLKGHSRTKLSSLVVSNAYYEGTPPKVKICAGFLVQSNSMFQIAYTLIHELMHSVDPCGVATAPRGEAFQYKPTSDPVKMDSQYPIPNLIECLRSEDSVNAQRAPGYGVPPAPVGGGMYPGNTTPGGGMGMGMGGPSGGMVNGGAPPKPKPLDFCERFEKGSPYEFMKKDQIGDAVADWGAAVGLPTYIETYAKSKKLQLSRNQYRNGYGNAMRLICELPEKEETPSYSDHSSDELRINAILLPNPKVRAHMGCPPSHSKYIHCDPNKQMTPANFPMPYPGFTPAPAEGGK